MVPLLRITRSYSKDSSKIPGSFPSDNSTRSLSPLTALSPPHLEPLKVPLTVSWQSSLSPSLSLSQLYLPGTHDSLALRYSLFGAQCQSLSIPSQLEMGIRFFDFRLRLHETSGELLSFHGSLPMGNNLGDVLEQIYTFLESSEGREETVIISFKQENTSNPLFASTLINLLKEKKEKWFFENRWPRLREVRGKCVLFCRFDFDAGLGLHPVNWPYDSKQVWDTEIGGKQVRVQDWHGLPSFLSIPLKSSLALSLFPSSSQFRINHLSASSPNPFKLAFPQFCAKGFLANQWFVKRGWGFKGVNELILEGLEGMERDREEKGEDGMGQGEGMVVMMDYCEFPRGGELVRKIIGMNSKVLLES